MQILEIRALDNGAHNNQTFNGELPPVGWAIIPDEMGELENFPFGDVVVAELDGVPTVTRWIPGTMPEPDPVPEKEPTTEEILDAMLGVK